MMVATFHASVLFIYIIPLTFTMTLRETRGYSQYIDEKIYAPRSLHNVFMVIQTVKDRVRILLPSVTPKPKLQIWHLSSLYK